MSKLLIALIYGFIYIVSTPLSASESDWADSLHLTTKRVLEPTFHSEMQLYFANEHQHHLTSITLIHGVGGSAQDFSEIIPDLAKHYKLVIVDLPGYGLSEKTKSLYSAANYANSLAQVLPAQINQNNIIIGHSMGGNISLQLLDIAPKIAQKLILIDAAGLLHKYSYSKYTALNQTKDIPFVGKNVQNKLGSVIDKINSWLPDSIVDIALSKAGRNVLLQQNANYISALSVMNENLTGLFSRINAPSLIIWGVDDPVMPSQTGIMLNALLKHSQLKFIQDAGHSPQKTQTNQVLTLITQFIGQNKIQDEPTKLTNMNPTDFILDCNTNNRTQLAQIAYRHIQISNCKDLSINQLTAESISLSRSNVTVHYLTLNNSTGFAIKSEQSQFAIWGGDIHSQNGLDLVNSQVDLNGVTIQVDSEMIKSDKLSHVLASLSQATEHQLLTHWHGFVLRSGVRQN